MKREYIITGVLVVLVGALVVFGPRLGWRVASFVAGGGASELPQDALRAEIVALKTELAKYERIALSPDTAGGTAAFVYSRYPFNFKDTLTISKGVRHGIEEKSVVLKDGVVIGMVDKTFQDAARVMTVFDPAFRASVRVGAQGVDALLVGGVVPRLTLISENRRVEAGNVVYTAFEGGPYGLPMGELADLKVSADQAFLEASLRVPYNIETTKEVVILPLPQ